MANALGIPAYDNPPQLLNTIFEETEAEIMKDDAESALEEEVMFMLGLNNLKESSPISPLSLYMESCGHANSTPPGSISTSIDLPPLPASPKRRNVEDYFQEVLDEADAYKERENKTRFQDLGFSAQEQAAMISRLEDVAYRENLQQGTMFDGDIILLQMFAISGLQQERQKLSRLTEALEKEIRVLQEVLHEHTEQRLHIVNTVVKKRGEELKQHGEFLIQIADQNSVPASIGI